MKYQKKIILHCPNGRPAGLEQLVADFRASGVIYVGVVGKDCSHIEDVIDEICVGLGEDAYDLLTASHPGESLDAALKLAKSLTGDFAGEVQILEV